MNMTRLINTLVIDEGEETNNSRHMMYTDSVGKITIGVGRNLSDRGISEDESRYMLNNDIQDTIKELRHNFSWYDGLNDVRKEVITNMAFNMGVPVFSGFKQTILFIERNQFVQASIEMLDSVWSAQVGERAQRLSREMASGVAEI